MTVEALVARTRDNCVLAFTINFANNAEKARLKLECETLAKNIDYRSGYRINFGAGISYDGVNTDFLNKEIYGYHYRKDRARFENGTLNEPPAQPDTLSLSYRIEDSFFPEVFKNLGFKVKPIDKTYETRYNPATGQYEAVNFVKTTAAVNSGSRELSIVRNHFHFSPEDFRRLKQLQAQYEQAKRINPHLTENEFAFNHLTDRKDSALFDFYAQKAENVRNLSTTLAHEMKHIKNAVFDDGLSLKCGSKRLSVENYYRAAVEDERSAYLEELVHNINTYLRRGDYDDFSMFYVNNYTFVQDLKRLRTPAERLAYVQNWPALVAKKMQDFEANHRASYDYGPENATLTADDIDADGDSKLRQFLQNTKNYVDRAPLCAPEDTDGAEFKKLRSLFYNYQIYNPQTHRMESVDLSRYLTPDMEVAIDQKIQDEIITPQKNRLNARLQNFETQRAGGTINPALVEPAKALMRGGVENSAFVNVIDNFRISSLYEPENGPTPPPPPTPNPNPIPDDRADWSNDLQQYWSGIEGYSEVAKNNEEYKFKVKDATVRYTSQKDVQISKNADFDLYVKMLKEPNNRNAPVEFLDTLGKEQALLLYIACINTGRQPIGAVPTDFSQINRLGIPAEELNKFQHRQQQIQQQSSGSQQNPPPARNGQSKQSCSVLMSARMRQKLQNTH